MKKLIIVLLLLGSAALAADRTYYSYPDATTVPDNARILMYDPAAGSKNVTGAKLRTSVSDTPISSQPVTSGNYKRVAEFKNNSGTITSYIQAGGIFVVGTPVALSISSIVPANGSTGFLGGPIMLTFSKDPHDLSSSYMYVYNVATANIYAGGDDLPSNIISSSAYLAPNTSYTYKVAINTLASLQVDGETSASCGTAMTNVSGVCQSTFTTGALNIYSIYPEAASTDIPGNNGSAFYPPPTITLGLTKTLTTGQFTCSSSYWNGSSWVNDTTPGAFSNTSNIIYTLPNIIYHKSYDASHLTTYTCNVAKAAGISTCTAGTTDTGTTCRWTFTTSI